MTKKTLTPALRWKSKAMVLHRHRTGPDTLADRHGAFPRYVANALAIARGAGALISLVKTCWRDHGMGALALERVTALRSDMNQAFDALEAQIRNGNFAKDSAIVDAAASAATKQAHGDYGMLALSLIEEAAELAGSLAKLADGSATLPILQHEVAQKAADLRISLHIATEQSMISVETTTDERFAQVAGQYPVEIFDLPTHAPRVISADALAAMSKKAA